MNKTYESLDKAMDNLIEAEVHLLDVPLLDKTILEQIRELRQQVGVLMNYYLQERKIQ